MGRKTWAKVTKKNGYFILSLIQETFIQSRSEDKETKGSTHPES